MTKQSRFERLMAVSCTYCKAQPGEYCVNVRNGKYARAGKTVTSWHWQRCDDAKRSNKASHAPYSSK